MKTKNNVNKLVLKKKTITNLDNTQLGKIQGGVFTDWCPTVGRTDCVTNCVQCPTVKCM